MINLLLAIVLTSLVYFIFKGFEQFKVQTFQAILVNYLVCVVTGILFTGPSVVLDDVTHLPGVYFFYPLILGVLFLIGFNLIAYSSQKISISLTSVASRLSLIVPVVVGLLIFKTASKDYTNLNNLGIFLVFVAIVFISIPSNKEKLNVQRKHLWLLPVLFLFGGVIDTLLSYTNELFEQIERQNSLLVMVFFVTFVGGLLATFVFEKKFRKQDILGGLVLSLPSYFSIHFLMRALSSFNNDSAFVFSITNLSVIGLTTVISMTLLKEKISRLNRFGLVVSIISLLLILS